MCVWLEMLVGIKSGGWAQNCYCNLIGRYKFDGLVWDRHTYMYVKMKVHVHL